MNKETRKNTLYIIHVALVQTGAICQIVKTYTTQSAGDLSLMWVLMLLGAECIALDRVFSSPYFVWKLAHVLAIILLIVLVAGVSIYG